MLVFSFFNLLLFGLFFIILISAVSVKIVKSRKLEKLIFIALSVACILLATLRPFGITHDDVNYEFLVEQVCKISECGFKQEITYDIGYFFILSIFKEFSDGVKALTLLAGFVLGLKLFIIARLTSFSILSLYFYYCVFFIYHDLTQLRVSMAIAIFLLALYLMLVLKKWFLGFVAYGAATLIHTQALIGPLPQLFSPIINRRHWFAIGLVVTSQIAVLNNITPESLFIKIFMNLDLGRLTQNLIVEQRKFGLSGTNLLIIFLLAVTVFPLKRMIAERNKFDVFFSSVVIGYVFYWMFAAIPVISDRILQFFLVPLAMLVSVGRTHNSTFIFATIVGAIFFGLTAFIAPILSQ